jgi:NitT/TauT family transport system permease protein
MIWGRIWGAATVLFDRTRKFGWIDLLLFVGLVGAFFGMISVVREWAAPTAAGQEAVHIELSPWYLPLYTFYSLTRGLLAYVLSLLFTLTYGYWAAKDRVAERVLLPLLDILQSLPVLAFMPGFVVTLTRLFPGYRVGEELAAILMIFTGQAWNMTFSYYHSLRSIPADLQEAATVYRFTWWKRLKWVELPFATMGLVWNSMMSMAGGWFFLMINEAFTLTLGGVTHDYRLPGIGSYMTEAIVAWRRDGQVAPMLWAILAMVLMIVILDQFLWRPVVAWAQKFRVEEGGAQEPATSWFLDWLRHSHLIRLLKVGFNRLRRLLWPLVVRKGKEHPGGPNHSGEKPADTERLLEAATNPPANHPGSGGMKWAGFLSLGVFVLLVVGLVYGGWVIVCLLWGLPGDETAPGVTLGQWGSLGLDAVLTLGRVLLAVIIGTLWTIPVGLWIGRSPRLSHLLQPVVQVAASFPAPMLFPLVVVGFQAAGIHDLEWGSILLMLLGTQWYILFNVIAGAMAIPADLKEAARSYRISGWRYFWVLSMPAIFPYLVTGWVTAAGGAWNASIVSEYITFKIPGLDLDLNPATGLGSAISMAFENPETHKPNFSMLAASVLVMAALVVAFNRLVWRYFYNLAATKYSLSK